MRTVENNRKEKLKNQIWKTRVSRINAERRLQQKQSFIQAIDIYYSCITIIYSIMSYVNSDNELSMITIFMSISLLIAIMHLNSQNYEKKALLYRENYTAMHKLELALEHTDDTKQIEEDYCDLLHDYSNHITFDYYCTIKGSKQDFRNTNGWKNIRVKYYWGVIWRTIIKISLILLPFVLYFFRGVI